MRLPNMLSLLSRSTPRPIGTRLARELRHLLADAVFEDFEGLAVEPGHQRSRRGR
jgi:hypothetical protein